MINKVDNKTKYKYRKNHIIRTILYGKQKYKDSVFRKLFNGKEKIIELYNALSESSYGSDANIEIVTLEDVLYDVFKNDLAFITNNKNNSFMDLKVKVININVEKNHRVLLLSRTLKEYGILI